MTQPQEAVGGASDTVVAAEPTIEDRFAAVVQDEEEKPEEAPSEEAEAAIEAEAEAALEPEDAEEEAEGDEPQPIKPPASLTTEEKETFKNLPRDAQEFVQRRIGDLEKGLHQKAQEAKATRSQVEQEASGHIRQILDTHAAQLQALMPQIAAMPDRSMLDINSSNYDPDNYHYLKSIHEDSLAQAGYVQQQLQAINQQRTNAEQASRQQAFQTELETLREALPEWFDPTEGPKLHAEMKSIATDLGYSAEQLNDATATEILALKKVSAYKAKADKYDTLMAKKMDQVRAAKGLPKVSKPGVPQGKGAAANQRYTADRNAMKKGDRDAEARVFSRFLNG